MLQVGNDIGGTFTDTIVLDEKTGELSIAKVLTTPEDPSVGAVRGIEKALREFGAAPEQMQKLIHGTTLVANALIERKGAKTALITTKGFRDVLEARTGKRFDLYDLSLDMPQPLVPRSLRRGVSERLAEEGTVLVQLDASEVERVVREFGAEGVKAIAVCFLHSFRNPAHELAVKRVIQQLAPHVCVSLSVEVLPEIREYQRTSTTVANAYTQPLMATYVSAMTKRLQDAGFGGPMHVMLSNGGITTSDTAREVPIRVVESGPAAGAIAASFYGQLMGLSRILSLDVGGTTAKICFIEDGKPTTTSRFEVARVHRFKKGSGLPIGLPVIDMIEIGAGGGSIAWTDKMGLLRVGPQSSGAAPGPACYGLGGKDPAVTDAHLVLGYLDAAYFLGGQMALSRKSAEEAISQKVANPLGLSLLQAAWGINEVVNESMVNAAKVYAAEKGKDTKNYALVAFGGAGPVQACWIAARLGVDKVVIPFGAGVTSALGFLCAPFAFDFVRTYMGRLATIDLDRINEVFAEMEAAGTRLLGGAGVKPASISLTRSCDMRYSGQVHEIEVPVPKGILGENERAVIQASFEREYQKLYHRVNPGYEIECMNWKLVASAPRPKLNLKTFPGDGRSLATAFKGERMVYFPQFGDYRSCRVYDRYRLFEGAAMEGPAVIEERESTLVVPPGAKVVADQFLNLLITL